jgi:hypothetical protein
MPLWNRTLLVLVLLATPLAAADPPFATELELGFGCEGSETGRPLVVLDGTPSASYAYSADARAHAIDVAATRWLAPVGDDGRTPLALVPYVSRVSSVVARLALTGASRDSFGSFSGQAASLDVRLAGDRTLREAGLSAEWFLTKGLAVRGGFSLDRERSTDASTSVESPSGRADVSTAGTRTSAASGSVGVALRLGDHEVSGSGSYGETDLNREDASAFTGGAQPSFSTLFSSAIAREATLATRLLFLDRRFAVDASGSYSLTTSASEVTSTLSGPVSGARAIARAAGVEATWFATRRLGLSAGFGYGTRSVASGSPGRLRPSRSETSRLYSARARWFASPRVSIAFSVSRAEEDETAPPDSSTFQRFDTTVDRVTFGAAVRF